MIDVIFDISVVGDPSSRSGLSRYGIELALGLHRSGRCNVGYCATGSLWAQHWARRFLADHPELSTHAMGDDCGMGLLGLQEKWRGVGAKGAAALAGVVNVLRASVSKKALGKADLFHSSYAKIPRSVRRSKNVARVLTVHDVIPLKIPQLVGDVGIRRFRQIIDSLAPGDFIVTVSQSTKNDLCQMLRLDPRRIFVTPLAAAKDYFYPCQDAERLQAVREKYKIPPGHFVLSLATMTPHKNMDFLVRGFAALIRQQPDCCLNLVLAGGRGNNTPHIEKMLEQEPALRGRVLITGYVDEGDLAPLYSAARMFAFPSLYEGFGLPVIEAMQCGAPVILSNRSSLPEVVGDAGLLLDPTDEAAWAQAMLDIAMNDATHAEMAARSVARAGTFTWQRCVNDTLSAYEAAVESRK